MIGIYVCIHMYVYMSVMWFLRRRDAVEGPSWFLGRGRRGQEGLWPCVGIAIVNCESHLLYCVVHRLLSWWRMRGAGVVVRKRAIIEHPGP